MAREQVTPDFPHTTFSVRTVKLGCEWLVPQPSCGDTGAEEGPTCWPLGPCPHGLGRPYRGQDVPTAAIEQEALAVEGDHVALPVECAGRGAAGTLPARPLAPGAGAVDRGGCRWLHMHSHWTGVLLGGPRDRPRPPGAPGRCGLPCLTVGVELCAPGVGDPCKLTRTFLGGYAVPGGVLVEPLGTDAARLTLGGYLQGGGQWPWEGGFAGSRPLPGPL